MIRTLRWKFVFINMALVSAILLVVFSAQCVSAYRKVERENGAALHRALERPAGQPMPKFEFGRMPPGEMFTFTPIILLWQGADGQVQVQSGEDVAVSQEDAQALYDRVIEADAIEGVLRTESLRYRKMETGSGVRVALIDRSNEADALRAAIATSGLLCLAGIAGFFLVSLFLSRWALRPVEKAWRQQRQFVADASHELKTPLTIILANGGILKSHPEQSVQSQMQWIDNTHGEALRMKTLVDDLLFLAKADDVRQEAQPSTVLLSDVVDNAALAFESVAFERNVRILADVQGDVRVMGEEARLRQMVGTLLDNAVKYAKSGGEVQIKLAARGGKARLSVANDGEAIPPEDLEHIFERFYRVDKSRAREGFGLGLSIARTVVEGHGGRLTAHSREGETVFEAELPLV